MIICMLMLSSAIFPNIIYNDSGFGCGFHFLLVLWFVDCLLVLVLWFVDFSGFCWFGVFFQ